MARFIRIPGVRRKGKSDTATVTVTFDNSRPIAQDDEGIAPDANPVTIVIGENDRVPMETKSLLLD